MLGTLTEECSFFRVCDVIFETEEHTIHELVFFLFLLLCFVSLIFSFILIRTNLNSEEWMKEVETIADPRTACWQVLERYLQRYDTPDTNFKYHLAVVDKILSTNSSIKLPLWLVASLKVKMFVC
jgi:hypothetical protein